MSSKHGITYRFQTAVALVSSNVLQTVETVRPAVTALLTVPKANQKLPLANSTNELDPLHHFPPLILT